MKESIYSDKEHFLSTGYEQLTADIFKSMSNTRLYDFVIVSELPSRLMAYEFEISSIYEMLDKIESMNEELSCIPPLEQINLEEVQFIGINGIITHKLEAGAFNEFINYGMVERSVKDGKIELFKKEYNILDLLEVVLSNHVNDIFYKKRMVFEF